MKPTSRLFGLLAAGLFGMATALAGSDDAFAAVRKRMVEEHLSGFGRCITDARVLTAMGMVPRHEFVPVPLRSHAYNDSPLPIGYGQSISQPYVVAFMTEKLEPQPTDKVLEVGTGSPTPMSTARRRRLQRLA